MLKNSSFKKSGNRCFWMIAAISTQLAVSNAAMAQSVLEEVVVTATKRESSLQDTPIAISALTSEQLTAYSIQSADDMISSVVGMEGSVGSGNLLVGIRGIAGNNIFINGDPAVAFNVDGVFRGRQTGGMALFHDLERIEVLKGPQGTLYGRNATGGNINVITAKPTQDLSGNIEALFGNYNRRGYRAVLNVPLIEDKLAIRAAVLTEKRDGYFNNGPAVANSYGDDDSFAFRLHALFTPTDRLSVLLTADRQERSGTGDGTNVLGGPDADLSTDLSNPYDILLNRQGFREDEFGTFRVEVNYSLDFADLTYIGAYYESDVAFGIDFDRNNVATDPLDIRVASEQVTHELRLASTGDSNLQWLAGVFLFDEDAERQRYLEIERIGLVKYYDAPDFNVKSAAIFGQGQLQLTDAVRLTVGLRYTDDEKIETDTTEEEIRRGVSTTVIGSERDSWTSLDWSLGIDWTPVENTMLYAKAATAYKAGGFNDPLTGITDPYYDPEDMLAFQIGQKSQFLDNTVQLNSEFFYYDYTDLQVTQIEPNATTPTRNAAAAEVWGFDGELVAIPTDNLQVNVGVAYLDASYTEFLQNNPLDGGAIVDLSGARFNKAPEWSVNLGLEYTFELQNGWQIIPRLRAAYRSEVKLLVFDDPGSLQPARTVTDASIDIYSPSGKWNVRLFANNLEDEAVWTGGGVNGRGDRTLTGRPPRFYGMSFKWSFDEG